MIDGTAATLALRNRALGTTVATTGSTSLSATALGFARAAGSFITDGFSAGMEVKGTGFSAANNEPSVITQVTAGFLTIDGGRTPQGATAGRTLTVSLPEGRSWENVDYEPVSKKPYVYEQFVPGAPARLLSFGSTEERGLYTLTLYGLPGYGIGGIRKTVDAIKARFSPNTTITAGSDTLRVLAVKAGQIIPMDTGWSACTIEVTWQAWSTNVIAA